MRLNDVYAANEILVKLRRAETWLSNVRGARAQLVLPGRGGVGLDSTAVTVEVPVEDAADFIKKYVLRLKDELRALGVEV